MVRHRSPSYDRVRDHDYRNPSIREPERERDYTKDEEHSSKRNRSQHSEICWFLDTLFAITRPNLRINGRTTEEPYDDEGEGYTIDGESILFMDDRNGAF
jgi:hypothetical protein